MRHTRHVVQLSSAESEKEAVTQGKAKPRVKSTEIIRRADNIINDDTMSDNSSTDDETYTLQYLVLLIMVCFIIFLQTSNKKKN